jgi:hypothetical protein
MPKDVGEVHSIVKTTVDPAISGKTANVAQNVDLNVNENGNVAQEVETPE